MGGWAICFSREIVQIEEEKARQRQLIREREEAARLKREEEESRIRWAEFYRLEMVAHLAAKGCPKGYSCELMGADGVGGCENWRVCRGW